jgi:hypothetical protein
MRLVIAGALLAVACAAPVRGPDGPSSDPDDDVAPLPLGPTRDDPPNDSNEPPPSNPPSDPPPSDPPPGNEPSDPTNPPVAPATRLTITAGPELVDALPGCQCTAPAPAANVDLFYLAAGQTPCGKPADPSCGVNGPNCRCSLGPNLGDALWGSGRTEEPRQPGEQWIVDEQIIHQGGGDGRFIVRARVSDDCLLSPGSTSLSANYGCCLLDCDGTLGNACYDYSQGGTSCSLFCDVRARAVTNADCMARGPVPVRIRVESDGGNAFAREWCVTLADEQGVDAIELVRTNGVYSIASVSSSVVEISPGGPCR